MGSKKAFSPQAIRVIMFSEFLGEEEVLTMNLFSTIKLCRQFVFRDTPASMTLEDILAQ